MRSLILSQHIDLRMRVIMRKFRSSSSLAVTKFRPLNSKVYVYILFLFLQAKHWLYAGHDHARGT